MNVCEYGGKAKRHSRRYIMGVITQFSGKGTAER